MNLCARLEQRLKGSPVPGVILACVGPAGRTLPARTGHHRWLIQSSVPALPKSNGRTEKSSDTKRRWFLSTVLSLLQKKNHNKKPTSCTDLRNHEQSV